MNSAIVVSSNSFETYVLVSMARENMIWNFIFVKDFTVEITIFTMILSTKINLSNLITYILLRFMTLVAKLIKILYNMSKS